MGLPRGGVTRRRPSDKDLGAGISTESEPRNTKSEDGGSVKKGRKSPEE